MLISYIKTALRAVQKDRQHFLLNVFGMAVGLAAAIMVALYAHNELSYDKQHPDGERVYRAHQDFTAWGLQVTGTSDYKVVTEMTKHADVEAMFSLQEIENLPDFQENGLALVNIDGNYQRLRHFYTASPNILDFVALETVDGDIASALQQPNQLVLSEREALRLFGSTQVVGHTLDYRAGQYRVGAVFKDLPENTHFRFDTLVHLSPKYGNELWGYNYYKLRPGADATALAKQMTDYAHSIWTGRWDEIKLHLVNLQELHFNTNGPFEMKQGGSQTTLQISIGLSLVLILIASINFINLNIAQSAKRAKEVGVRKALGATRGQLISQFLTESLLVVSLAGILAFTLIEICLPGFNQLVDRQLTLDYGSSFAWLCFLVILAVGVLSGLYPALFIASFSAKRVLSGDLANGSTAIMVRKLTLCLQGALSVGLIIAALSLYQQMTLINNLEVGYEKASRIIVKDLPATEIFKQEHNSLLEAVTRLQGVEQVTLSSTDLTNDMNGERHYTWPNGEQLSGPQPSIATGYHAAEVLGLKLVAGRDFSPQFAGDWDQRDADGNRTLGILVTKRMAEMAGYQDMNAVVGMKLTIARLNMTATVVGVVDNVKIGSVRQQALPASFGLGSNPQPLGHLVIKASTENLAELSRRIRTVIEQQLHLSDVNLSLVSDDYRAIHNNEQRALEMVSLFSLLAIFLTCLGTFGLASFAALRRQKEVAVRKVLGASRLSIMNLLAKEFLILVGVGVALAYPLTYWLVGDWLANFNERIDQALWVYLLAAVGVAVITWLTVASLAFKAASTRPSLILRYE